MTAFPERARKALERARGMLDVGNAQAAATELEKVVAKVPKGEEAWLMLGRASSQIGNHRRALECFRRVTTLNPRDSLGWFNCGVAAASLGQFSDAIAAYGEAALRAKGNYPDAVRNVAWCHIQLDNYAQALAVCNDYLDRFPPNGQVHFLKGVALQGQQDLAAAAASYRQAIESGARDAMAHLNLGVCLHALEDFEGAKEQAEIAIRRMPQEPVTRLNLGLAQAQLGEIEAAIETLGATPHPQAQIHRLAAMNYLDPFDIDRAVAAHRAWGTAIAATCASAAGIEATPALAGRKLRLGMVSADFRVHPVAFFIEGLLGQIDRDRFELVLYFDAPNRDHVTDRFRDLADEWVELHPIHDHALAADRIRSDRIDILFDLGGMTSSRIAMFGHRMAPVQTSYLGYGLTTGLPTIDYVLSDELLDPAGLTDRHYSERVLRLGTCFATYTPPVDAPAATASPVAAGRAPTFASVARVSKISDSTLALWARALDAVPDARLLIVSQGLQNAATRDRLLARCAAHGLDANRISARGAVPLEEYFALHQEIDLFLDTQPWSGHTTTLHGLWMGVPTATVEPEHHTGRFSAMVMRNAGLPEFIAESRDDFGTHVRNLIDKPDLFQRVRDEGRERVRTSALCDHARLARHFERACEAMWARAARA